MKPDEGYIAYIVNPKSGASNSELTVWEFERYLKNNGFDVRKTLTKSLEHACELATAAAADDNCPVVIAAGGDGTIREIAHGLEGSGKTLMPIPAGTENLLASELGFDAKLRTLIDTFDQGQVKNLDLCNANGRCFTSIAGIGFDADIVKLVDTHRQGHITYFNYCRPVWETLCNHKFPEVHVEVDGEELFQGRALVFAGNISRYAMGLQILHYADFGDGLLDVCIYKCRSKAQLAKHSLMTVLKHHTERQSVIYRQCKKVRVSAAEPVAAQIDGDPGPALPLEISIMPQAVKVLVPYNAKPAGIRTRLKRLIG